jgi:hypothetical protein
MLKPLSVSRVLVPFAFRLIWRSASTCNIYVSRYFLFHHVPLSCIRPCSCTFSCFANFLKQLAHRTHWQYRPSRIPLFIFRNTVCGSVRNGS